MRDNLLNLMLSGPLLRRVTQHSVCFVYITSLAVKSRLSLNGLSYSTSTCRTATTTIQLAENLYLHLVELPLKAELKAGEWVGYNLELATLDKPNDWLDWQSWAPDLCYADNPSPGFLYQPTIHSILHGSCRKPHHNSQDGLVEADRQLAKLFELPIEKRFAEWPSLLMMSGDQVYADDVAAPMLVAIHQLIKRLGFPNEAFSGALVDCSATLHQDQPSYYHRHQLLPEEQSQVQLSFFGGVRKPIFTSDNAQNHLISFAEMVAIYLLIWSPSCWDQLSIKMPDGLDDEQKALFIAEQQIIEEFAKNLSQVRRLMAHLPVAMIFDDHDVTDDWNLTAAWEQLAYNNPFSKRIIGNALLAYTLFQGWGNAPESFSKPFLEKLGKVVSTLEPDTQDSLIDQLIRFDQWHYHWDTTPILIVLDTRTQRWRSERSIDQPSGLMDWESLTELQSQLINQPSVLLVSPAPVFGVKLIEIIQRVFTWFGKPLLVDAENWMAHPGSAQTLLNLFHHRKTPPHFIILSGDVHYSFAYDIALRRRKKGPDIYQITSSGIKNQFPTKLLDVLDRMNRWLFSPRSPLNWFTRRREMKISPRKPSSAKRGERLLNASGIGVLTLDKKGIPTKIAQFCSDGSEVCFLNEESPSKKSS